MPGQPTSARRAPRPRRTIPWRSGEALFNASAARLLRLPLDRPRREPRRARRSPASPRPPPRASRAADYHGQGHRRRQATSASRSSIPTRYVLAGPDLLGRRPVAHAARLRPDAEARADRPARRLPAHAQVRGARHALPLAARRLPVLRRGPAALRPADGRSACWRPPSTSGPIRSRPPALRRRRRRSTPTCCIVWVLTGFMGAAYWLVPEESRDRAPQRPRLAYWQLGALDARWASPRSSATCSAGPRGTSCSSSRCPLKLAIVVVMLMFLYNLGMTIRKARPAHDHRGRAGGRPGAARRSCTCRRCSSSTTTR